MSAADDPTYPLYLAIKDAIRNGKPTSVYDIHPLTDAVMPVVITALETKRTEVLAEAAAALTARAVELSAMAEEELRRDLEETAQEWHSAALVVAKLITGSTGKDTSGQPAGESTQPAPGPQFADIRTREAAAVPGPWYTDTLTEDDGTITVGVATADDTFVIELSDIHPADAEFIAHARADVPVLLAEVDRLRTALSDQADQAAPEDFFQPERTYTRPSHGRTVTFQVTHISTAPDGTTVTAFGWHQIEGYDTWQAYSSEDFDNGWTEVTDGGVRATAHAPSVSGTCARARGTYDWVNGTTPELETPCRPYPELRCVASCRISEGEVPRG